MNSNIVQPIVSTNLFKVNHSSLWSSPSTMSSQCVNPPHVVNGQAPLIRFQILNAAQSSSFGTKAARIIMTSPNSTSNTHIQSSLDHSRLATLKVDVPKQISPSRIDIPILKANNVKTLDDLDISPHFIKPISQSTPSSSEKRKTKQIEEPGERPYNDDSLLSDSMIMQEEEGQLFSMANGGADTCISTQYGAESKELIDLENIEDSSIVDQECDEKKRSSLGPDCVLKSNPVVKNGEKKNLKRKKKTSELKFDMIQDLLKKLNKLITLRQNRRRRWWSCSKSKQHYNMKV
ncbi:unnamed protein product [Rotaria magnacalcarata]|nr:unnamed protein product [Rotaria magnacalcarata]